MGLGTSVGSSGEVLVEVDISAQSLGIPGAPETVGQTTKVLMADTGAKVTIIPWENIQDWFGFTALEPGPVGKVLGVAGEGVNIVKLVNATMTVEVGNPRTAGPPPANQPKTCSSIFAKVGGIRYGGYSGVLGRDQLGTLQADPVMNIDQTHAWLEPRKP